MPRATGTEIRSVGDGIVTELSITCGKWQLCKNQNINGTYTDNNIFHMSEKSAKANESSGQRIKQGIVIGFVAVALDLQAGPHLCFRFVRKNGKQGKIALSGKKPPFRTQFCKPKTCWH